MIPVCEPTLGEKEKKYLMECIETGWISSAGKFLEEFENKFSAYCGVKYGIACSNGTTALHLATASLGIGPGDEVIVPDFSIISLANAVIYTGAKPVFVDSEIKTWNIDAEKIEEKITPNTKAIIAMHTYGCPAEMGRITAIAKKHGLKVIEDAAEAHGAEYKGNKTGSLGDIACFSFYANKIITTGEGGMVVTSDEKLAEKARSLRNLAFTKPRYKHYDIGFNYRMTNMQAAVGLAQLERIDQLRDMRIMNALLYNKGLKGISGITTPPECQDGKNVYWMYGILVDKEKFGMGKNELAKALNEKGIDTREFFYPMHMQPVFKKMPVIECSGKYPVSEMLCEQGFYLPSSSHLKPEQIKLICETIKSLKK
jgi:perosamine synthetase